MSRQAGRWKQGSPTQNNREAESLTFNAPSIPLTKTFDRPYGPLQRIDLEFLGTRPQIASVLADTFWMQMASTTDFTRRGRVSHLKTFSTFLDWTAKKGPPVTNLSDITFELLGAFVRWLVDQRALKEVSAVAVYQAVTRHLRAARRLHPKEFQADFEIPYHGLDWRHKGSATLIKMFSQRSFVQQKSEPEKFKMTIPVGIFLHTAMI